MAKYEVYLKGDFGRFVDNIHNELSTSSISASYEDGSDYSVGNIRVAVRVYERYSMMGGNRVSLNVTVVGNGEDIFLSAITSGGSQALFFKFNTFGEKAYLDVCKNVVERYMGR